MSTSVLVLRRAPKQRGAITGLGVPTRECSGCRPGISFRLVGFAEQNTNLQKPSPRGPCTRYSDHESRFLPSG